MASHTAAPPRTAPDHAPDRAPAPTSASAVAASATDYDLITIGAGSGGVAASRRAASHGARVAIVEGSRVGGTCVIRGCVPKKLLMYAAQLGDAVKDAAAYGWQVEQGRFHMPHWASTKAAEIDRLEGIYRKLLAGSGVTLFEGHAHIDGPGQVVVKSTDGEVTLRAPKILIATGGSPVGDAIPGLEHCPTSDDLLDLQTLPERAAIIGGGYIGVEFAAILARLGVKVSLYYRAALPLRGFDETLRSAAAAALQSAGIQLHPGNVPQQVQKTDGSYLLMLSGDRMVEFPWVLNATGRRPNTANLNLQSVGIAVDGVGAIAVDETMKTGAEGIFAIGDVTDRINLTPVAIAEGRAFADSVFGNTPRTVDLSRVASAVFMIPPMASVGPSEQQAAAEGHAFRVYETEFRPMKQAFIDGSERTHMKLLVDTADDKVLAVHMIGSDAPEIVQALAVALSAGATKADFDRTIAMHPTAAEEFVLMREAARTVESALATPKTAALAEAEIEQRTVS